MSSRVRALNVTHVRPEQGHHGVDHAIELSLFDTVCIAVTPVRRLFFYQGDRLPPFDSLVLSLQSSLAATLAVYTPLAGRLAVSSSGDVVVDCSPGAVSLGVRFVEAEYAGGAEEMRRLAGDPEHDAEAFLQLVPALAVGALPAPVLAVQVTRPAGGDGGIVAVGVSVSHTVVDGRALWHFLLAWAAAAREGSPAGAGLPPPSFDRAAINCRPQAEEVARKFLRMFAPTLPTVNTFPEPDMSRQCQRTYLLGASQIQSLKQRILLQSEGATASQPGVAKPPTTHAAVASLVWTSVVRSDRRHGDDGDDAYLLFAADCRSRLRPPLDGAFFGNCATSCCARATAGELRGGAALARAAAAVRGAVREYLEEQDPAAATERWVEHHAALPPERTVHIASSHRFAAYETDFGWGAPSRVELAAAFMRDFVALLGAPDGAVQVSVELDRDRIHGFEASFLSQLDGLHSA
ncbi:hypothetical protein ACP70R_021049 [Stipagrostis hirtigluma subsp. patula]